MHWKRWITALIAMPLIGWLIIKGGPTIFALTVAVVSIIALWEYFRIAFVDDPPSAILPFSIWAYTISAAMMLATRYSPRGAMTFVVIHLIGAAVFSILRFQRLQVAHKIVIKQVFGLIYIPFFMSFTVLLYVGSNGIHWIFFLLLVVAAGDTGAYYVGSYWGSHKLCPSVSPKKTIEGAVGGLAANLLAGFFYKIIFFPSLPAVDCLALALCAGAVGQAGDLFESEFKRAAGVKDSSRLLPGHGGVWDRIDALLFAAPVTYLLKELLLS